MGVGPGGWEEQYHPRYWMDISRLLDEAGGSSNFNGVEVGDGGQHSRNGGVRRVTFPRQMISMLPVKTMSSMIMLNPKTRFAYSRPGPKCAVFLNVPLDCNMYGFFSLVSKHR